MEKKAFFTILTRYGAARMAAAALSGTPVNLATMAVGDGGGSAVVPDPDRGLVNEVFRAPLNRVVIAEPSENIIRAEMIMQPQTGGFWLREAAIYDDSGGCVAVASLPPSYKPVLAEGSGRLQSINLWIAVSNTENVEVTADPTVIIASVDEVNRAEASAKDYADRVMQTLEDSLQEAIKNAADRARADAWENDNPVGTVRFFNQNVNPNQRWPQSKWVYTGENRSIRVGAADGSNVGTAGGNDTVRIEQRHLPAVQLDVSGETSEEAAQVIETTSGGLHRHGTFGEAPGVGVWPFGFYDEKPQYLGSNDSDGDNGLLNSTEDGDHNHEATVPAHGHTVSGKTVNLGQGQDLSIVESHILLMCWARIA